MDGPAARDLRVSRRVVIPAAELEWRFSAAGGPGGQHANTANTKAEVSFDVEASSVLGPRQRARLLDALGPVVRVTASDRRSQHQNRELALARLQSKLAAALVEPKVRTPTRPSRAAKARRVESKRRRSETKQGRGRVSPDD